MSSRTGRKLEGHGLRFADVETGDWFDTPAHEVTDRDIDRFADLTGDRFEIHMDDAAAKAAGFPSRVAHGLLVLSIVDGLKNQASARFKAIASLGWNMRFSKPVLIGDTLRARITVADKRETRDPARGILTLAVEVTNQAGTTVQAGTNHLMVHRT